MVDVVRAADRARHLPIHVGAPQLEPDRRDVRELPRRPLRHVVAVTVPLNRPKALAEYASLLWAYRSDVAERNRSGELARVRVEHVGRPEDLLLE